MDEQKRFGNFNKLAWFLAPVAIAAVLLAGGVSVIMTHAAPSLSGNYNFQAKVNVGGSGSQSGMTISGQLDLQASGQNVQGKLCNVTVTLSSGLVNSGLLNNVPLTGLLSNGLLNTGPITLSGDSNVCLNVTGTVSGTDAITMTVLNLLPGQNLDLSGLPNASLGSAGGLSGSLQLNLGLVQAGGSWSALLTASN